MLATWGSFERHFLATTPDVDLFFSLAVYHCDEIFETRIHNEDKIAQPYVNTNTFRIWIETLSSEVPQIRQIYLHDDRGVREAIVSDHYSDAATDETYFGETSMFRKISLAHLMIKHFAHDHDQHQYTIVARDRPDAFWPDPVPVSTWTQAAIYYPKNCGFGGMNDQRACGPPELMDIYSDLYFFYPDATGGINSETNLQIYLSTQHVRVIAVEHTGVVLCHADFLKYCSPAAFAQGLLSDDTGAPSLMSEVNQRGFGCIP